MSQQPIIKAICIPQGRKCQPGRKCILANKTAVTFKQRLTKVKIPSPASAADVRRKLEEEGEAKQKQN